MKKLHTWRRWDTPQNFLLAFIHELWKTRKIRILIKWKTKKKQKKYAGDIIILHMCTKHYNHKRYSSWDTEWDRIFCHFGSFFTLLPHPLTQPRKPKFWKNEKSIWRCHHFKLEQQKTQLNDVYLLRYGVQDNFLSF